MTHQLQFCCKLSRCLWCQIASKPSAWQRFLEECLGGRLLCRCVWGRSLLRTVAIVARVATGKDCISWSRHKPNQTARNSKKDTATSEPNLSCLTNKRKDRLMGVTDSSSRTTPSLRQRIRLKDNPIFGSRDYECFASQPDFTSIRNRSISLFTLMYLSPFSSEVVDIFKSIISPEQSSR